MLGAITVLVRKSRSKELTQKNTETPDICLKTVAALCSQENLWSCVTKCSTVSECSKLGTWRQYLCKSKINKFDHARTSNHHVFWLQISINNVELVKRLQRANNLACVVTYPRSFPWSTSCEVFKVCLVLKQPKEVWPLQVLKHKVDIVLVGESLLQFHNVLKRKARTFILILGEVL